MELWTLVLLLSLSISLSIALSYLLSHTQKKNKERLPPGPPFIPILTTILWLRRSVFQLEPLLRRLRVEYGPIITLHIASRPDIIISDRRLAYLALVQKGAAFADRPPATAADRILTSNQLNIPTATQGPLWRLLRRNLSSEMLHPSKVKLFSPARRWVVQVLLDHLKAQSKTNDQVVVVMKGFQFTIFYLVVLMCFGEKLDEKKIREIEDVQRSVLTNFVKFNVFAFVPRITKLVFRKRWEALTQIRGKQEEIFLPLIRGRKEGKEEREKGGSFAYSYVDSLLDVRLHEEGGRGLTDDELVSLCSEFMRGGTDTTATTLQWIMAELVKNQGIQKKLSEEIERVVGGDELREEDLQRMPYLKAVILEGLRRHPPVHLLLPHSVTEEVSFEGYAIPKNATINFTVAEMGWDGKVWEDPMEFRPERFLGGREGEGVDLTGTREIKMMPFGAGRRVCPGIGLALLHLEYFVANLVREYEWKAVEGEEVDLSENLEFTVAMKNPLRARISPRRNKGNEGRGAFLPDMVGDCK